MEISKQINDLLEKYECTAKELANASGLSVSVISRYRNGTRKPSELQLEKLFRGFASIAEKRGETFDTLQSLNMSSQKSKDMDMFIRKFNILINTFDINMNDFARFSNYDPSFISRIRSKQRTISDSDSFAEKIGEFLNAKYRNKEYDNAVRALTGIPAVTQSSQDYVQGIRDWLLSYTAPIGSPLMPLNSIPTDTDGQFSLPDTTVTEFSDVRSYGGTDEVCQGELDFLRYALADDHVTQLYIFNEMSHFIFRHEELAGEWMGLMSLIIQKGISVTIIHNIEQPFEDIVMGIQKMFPLYMTGCLKPYYLPTARSDVYYHICGCTDRMVMYGEGVHGHENHVRLNLDRTPSSLEYYQKEMHVLMDKAKPLMNVYQKDNGLTFRQFMRADMHTVGDRKGLLSSMPLNTMSEELLISILTRQSASPEEIDNILEAYREMKENVAALVKHSSVTDEVFILSEEEFRQKPVPLSLSYAFADRNFYYTYEEYLEHQRQTQQFAEQTSNYHLHFRDAPPLQNINIFIHERKWVSVSKSHLPAIHCVIRHPDIRRAIEHIVFSLSNP